MSKIISGYQHTVLCIANRKTNNGQARTATRLRRYGDEEHGEVRLALVIIFKLIQISKKESLQRYVPDLATLATLLTPSP